MSGPDLTRLLHLCDGPRDGALLRVSIANQMLLRGDPAGAIAQLQRAVVFEPRYSAAWRLLGQTLAKSGNPEAALEAFRSGIVAANTRGDKQAEKEMQVFMRRLEKAAPRGTD